MTDGSEWHFSSSHSKVHSKIFNFSFFSEMLKAGQRCRVMVSTRHARSGKRRTRQDYARTTGEIYQEMVEERNKGSGVNE